MKATERGSAQSSCAYCGLLVSDLKAIPWWRKGVNWICGIEEHPEIPELTEEEKEELEKKQTSLDELPRNRMICNINAVILLTIAVFFWTFFA